MIISSAAAGRIVSDARIVQSVPELLGAREIYCAAERNYRSKQNCRDCDKVSLFAPAEEAALQSIMALTGDAVVRLRNYLNRGELYYYQPRPGQAPEIRQLK